MATACPGTFRNILRKVKTGATRTAIAGSPCWAAVINTIVLIAGPPIILSEAVPRLFAPEHPKADGMLILAVVGVVVNSLAVFRLRRGESMNVRVVAWHLLEDVLGWAAVLIVSMILLFKDIHVLDPILSILITLYVLYNVLRNLRKTLIIFLQGVPEGVDIPAIEESILRIDKVQSVHHTHVWSLDGEHNVLSTHVVLTNVTNQEESLRIKRKIRALLQDGRCEHVTIEVEYEDEKCEEG